MVHMLPSFLRRIVKQKGSKRSEPNLSKQHESKESESSSVAGSSVPGTPLAGSVDRRNCGDPCTPPIEGHVTPRCDLFEGGVTSNIATIALGDWGYPTLDNIQEEVKSSGKYFTGLLRNYVNSTDPLGGFIAASRNNLIPKVEESDFSEYIRQISVLYLTMDKETTTVHGGNSNASVSTTTTEDALDSQVPKEYYSEDYDLAANEVFRQGLENIPTIMASLEAQLSTVNGELQELLERRYGHVHEACISVEELYKQFLYVTNQINRIRIDLEGGSSSGGGGGTATSSSDLITQHERLKAANPINNVELDWILESGLERKRSLQTLLNHLQVLRAVAAIPEYIQGIADSNGLAMANIIRDYVVHYIQHELSEFKLAQSVASVLGETVSNVERVAETKFINLALVALVEVSGSTCINDGVESLKAMLNQMHQPLIALLNASSMQSALDMLTATSRDAKATFTYMDYDTWSDLVEGFEKHSASLISALFLSHVWGCMLLRRVLCVERSKTRSDHLLTTESSIGLIKKLLLVIQDRFGSVTPRGNMTKVSYISSLISKTITLPRLCDECMDYGRIFETGIVSEIGLHQNHDSETTEDGDFKTFAGYVDSVKGIIHNVAVNTFEDFSKHLVISCNLAVDFKVVEFVTFVEKLRAFKSRYEQLLVDIKAKALFDAMTSASLSRELQAHGSSGLVDILDSEIYNERDTDSIFQELADRAILSIGASCLEPLKLGNIMTVQKTLAEERWDEFRVHNVKVDDDDVSYALVMSTSIIDERLNLYSLLADVVPSTGDDATHDCVQVLALYYSLLDAQASILLSIEAELDETNMRKACLMAESLRYFSRRVMDVAGNVLNENTEDGIEGSSDYDDDGDESKSQDYYISAEKCSDNLESLKQRIMHVISTDIGNKMKQHMLMWILQPTDSPYDDTELQQMIQVVQQSVDIISVVLKDVTDVQMVFEIAFQQLHASVPRDEIKVERIDEFRDSCMEFITRLSHNTSIKLEICWLADTLSNELFS